VLTAVAALVMLLNSSPAHALIRDDGDDPGQGLTTLAWTGIFIGLPVLLFVVIALLVYAPSMARGPRYRPDLGWEHAPVWFDGPSDDSGQRAAPGAATVTGGGASARW
jgi:hypothetical protein